MYDNFYLREYFSDIGRFYSRKTVVHCTTCPKCEKKRVNIYFKDGTWMCRECREKEIGTDE